MHARLAHPKTAGVLAAAALLLAGCASDGPAPSQSPDPPSPVAAIEASMLLPAADMPPWNGAIVWQQADDPAVA